MDRLTSAERSTDIAIAETAELAAAILRARIAINLAPGIGHEAVDAIASHLASQMEGRRHLIAAHAVLADIKARSPMRTLSFGGGANKEVTGLDASGGHLSLVDQVAA